MFRVCEQMLQCPSRPMPNLERKWKSNVEIAPNCPRCASANTKFCYYNNYSLSQPRYFCKACRRYWTKGGSLRNVPVGGGCRKSRRARSSTTRLDRTTAHLPFSYNTKSSTTFTTTNSSPDDGDSAGDQPASGADIDLAVVFAKFLNQSSTTADENLPKEAANVNIEGVDEDEAAVWSCLDQDSTNSCSQNDSSSISLPDQSNYNNNMLQEMPHHQIIDHQSMLETADHDHVNAFGLMTNLLPDHDHEILVQDAAAAALWPSDHHHAATTTATALPHFEWQLQHEIDHSFPEDIDHDQLKISAIENWSCFDLSGFGIFSRP